MWLACLALLLLLASRAETADWVVAEAGGDFTEIQAALDVAVAGDTITVREKTQPYFEKIFFPRDGDPIAGPIVLRASPGERPVLDGTGVAGSDMVLIDSRSHVHLIGFEIRNNLDVNDGSGVRVLGSGSGVQIRDNRIHDIRGQHAMGITVYGTEPAPISDLIIDGNEIYDCEPFQSEALTLNGNVTDFEVTHNTVRDVNNIGIDFIGGETDIQPDPTLVARNGVCRGNRVYRANEQGGGYAGGIYVDGARNIFIENNIVAESDLGIEVGAENPGTDAQNIVVRNNLLHGNLRACIAFGGYRASVGRVTGSSFLNNTCYKNDVLGEGVGELWIQYASQNQVRNNLFYSTSQNVLLYSEDGNLDNTLDYNLFFTEAGAAAAAFTWRGTHYLGFDAYRSGSGQDAHSLLADPRLLLPESLDFHLGALSPAIDAGDPGRVVAPGETDLDAEPRLSGARVDIGVDETEGSPAVPACGDGIDNDGDGLVDFPDDPGCHDRRQALEDPECNDGVDNDGDLLTDYPEDPNCLFTWADDESFVFYPVCGLGAELALFLAPLLLLAWGRRSGRVRPSRAR
jgi:hypothetical protein